PRYSGRRSAHGEVGARILEGDTGHEAPSDHLSLLVPPRRVAGDTADARARKITGLRRRLRQGSVSAGGAALPSCPFGCVARLGRSVGGDYLDVALSPVYPDPVACVYARRDTGRPDDGWNA